MTVLDCMKDIWKKVKAQIKAKIVWIYSNSGTSGTFAAAERDKNYKANCATIANWCFRILGIFKAGMYVYGKLGGTLACSDETLAALKKHCTLVHVNGKKTVDMCIKDGWLLPGDVVTYVDIQHTNIYAGKGWWYDAGHAYCRESGEGARFITWRGKTVYGDQRIAYIISYPKREKVYRVRVGIYKRAANAASTGNKILKELKLETFAESFTNGTHLFCGSFDTKAAANERKKLLEGHGFKAKTISPW